MDGIGDLADGAVEDVGVDLAPGVGVGTTADQVDRAELAFDEFFDMGEEPARVEGDAFKDGADELRAGGAKRYVVEGAAYVVIVDRGTFAVEPGGEDQVIAAGGGLFDDAVKGGVGVGVFWAGGEFVVGVEEVVAEEGEACACGFLFVGEEVATGDGRGEGGDVVEDVGFFEGDVAEEP